MNDDVVVATLDRINNRTSDTIINVETMFDLFDVIDRFTQIILAKTQITDHDGKEVIVVTDVTLAKLDVTEDLILLALENTLSCRKTFELINDKRHGEEKPTLTTREMIDYRRDKLEQLIKENSHDI